MSTEIKKNLLLVDDDYDLLTQLELQFKKAGFNVVTADSQEAAEETLKSYTPDLVISDLMMENIDGGFSLSYYIKKKMPNVPVIIITSVTSNTGMKFSASSDDGQRWIKANVILNKPIKFDDLLKEVNKYI
jgi:DNA-binding response OmpR family regulator